MYDFQLISLGVFILSQHMCRFSLVPRRYTHRADALISAMCLMVGQDDAEQRLGKRLVSIQIGSYFARFTEEINGNGIHFALW